jgi:hypothetical protein
MAKMAGLHAEQFEIPEHDCDHEADCEVCESEECEDCRHYVWLQGCDSCGSSRGCRCDELYDAYRDSRY